MALVNEAEVSTRAFARTITSPEGLEALAPEWEALAECAAQGLPMLSHAWQRSVFDHLLEDEERWAVVTARQGRRLVGVMPIVVTPHAVLRGLRPRVRVVWKTPTAHGDLLVETGRAPVALPVLVRGALDHVQHPLVIELGGVRDTSPTLAHYDVLARFGTARREPDGAGARVPTSGPIEGWWSRVHPNLRATLDAAVARAEAAGIGTPESWFFTRAHADPSWTTRFAKLRPDVDEPTRRFEADVARRLARLGWLEWHVLRIGTRDVAAHLAARTGRTLTLLARMHDPSASEFAPDRLLMKACLERAFEDDTVEVNLLHAEPWQVDWNVTRDAYERIRLAPGLTGRLIGG